MSKISKTLVELKETLREVSGLFYYYSLQERQDRVTEFISIFDHVLDSRMKNMCLYSTCDIIAIVFMAVLDGRSTWKEIEDFCHDYKDFLSSFIIFPGQTPSHDTFCRVYSLLDSKTLEAATICFIEKAVKDFANAVLVKEAVEKPKVIAMDGKEERGSGRKYNTDEKVLNTQIMHIYDTDTQICISSSTIADKTNEIPTAQALLKTLEIKGMIITADAMNAQKETVHVIRSKKAHYVLGLKGNHKDFHEEAAIVFEKSEPKLREKDSKSYFKMETEKNHNQVEVREFFKLSAKKFYQEGEWEGLKSVVKYKKSTFNIITKEENTEIRYYISDLNDVELIADSIRAHWGVENGLHWHLDTNFAEDANSTMNKRALHNLSIMNKMVLVLMKLMSPLFRNGSIKRTRKSFESHFESNVLKMFGLLDGKDLKKLFDK